MIPKTSHSLNQVPFCVALHDEDRARYQLKAIANPGLGNIAGSAATLLGYELPDFFLPGLIDIKKT